MLFLTRLAERGVFWDLELQDWLSVLCWVTMAACVCPAGMGLGSAPRPHCLHQDLGRAVLG